MTQDLAATITRSASRQTYATIRFLVDRARVADAFRAYAYFRWVDDILDAEAPQALRGEAWQRGRLGFLERQTTLLEACLRGDRPPDPDPHERMLVDLVLHSDPRDTGLRSYLRQMMWVMAFDARRRGRLVSQGELDAYTRALAIAVSDAMHHFIGHRSDDPEDDPARYRAVEGAHIIHMLRDTGVDVRAGYFNVPRELLEAASIGPSDVGHDAYRAWVRQRVRQARLDLAAGTAYYSRVESRRHRLAGLAYIARFSWLTDRIERDDFLLRPSYAEAMGPATGLRMAGSVVASMARPPRRWPREKVPLPHGGGGP